MRYLLQKYAQLRKWCERHFLKLLITLVLYISFLFYYGYKIPWFDKHPDWGYFPQHTNPNIVIEEIKMDSVKLETIVTPLNSNKKLIFGYKLNKNGDYFLLIYNEKLQLIYSEKFPFLEKWFYPELDSNRIVIKYDSSYRINDKTMGNQRCIAYNFATFKKSILPPDYYCSKDTSYRNNIIEIGYFRYRSFPYDKSVNIKLIDSVVVGNVFHKGSWWDRFNMSYMSGGNSTGHQYSETKSKFVQEQIGYCKLFIDSTSTNLKLQNHYIYFDFFQLNTPFHLKDTMYFNYYHNFYRVFVKK